MDDVYIVLLLQRGAKMILVLFLKYGKYKDISNRVFVAQG